MNPVTQGMEGNVSAPVLYMALELSNKTWRLALSDGAKRRQAVVPAADLMNSGAVAKAKERFGMPASARVVSCYEAGRDGFWLHRHPLAGRGVEHLFVARFSTGTVGPSSLGRRPATPFPLLGSGVTCRTVLHLQRI
jgi:transposase